MMKVKKEVLVYYFGILFFFTLSIFFVASQNVPTEIDIENSPPVLVQLIPNQSWDGLNPLNNAFDLDNYFMDPNGDLLNYSFSPIANVVVTIDSNNVVSFSPDSGFSGQRNITFTASDGSFNATSNLVYLNIGNDQIPPQWTSPSRLPVTAYQNAFVNFTTLWTDNLALRDFTFSINQGSGFISSSVVAFTGIQNTSRFQSQISAAEGNNVFWYFCASDTSSNSNCTDIQNFTVSPIPESNGTEEDVGDVSNPIQDFFDEILGGEEVSNFTVSPDFFNVNVKQGTTTTRALTISNIGTLNLSFQIQIESVDKFVSISTKNFSLEFGQSKDLVLDFTAEDDTPVGDYFGYILVKTSTASKKIPIAIIVNPFELEFEVNVVISPEFKEIVPGQRVLANISIMNNKDPPRSQLELYYAIKDFSGNIYDSSIENISLNDRISLERNLSLPPNSELGRYLFYARATTGESTAIGSDTFLLGSLFDFAAIFRFTIIFITIFLLSGFSISLFLGYMREKEKERLLNLYLMLTELKELIKEGDSEKALNLYVRIKASYGEPVSKTALENKDKLKQEIITLTAKLNEKLKHVDSEIRNEIVDAVKEEGKNPEKKEDKKD